MFGEMMDFKSMIGNALKEAGININDFKKVGKAFEEICNTIDRIEKKQDEILKAIKELSVEVENDDDSNES